MLRRAGEIAAPGGVRAEHVVQVPQEATRWRPVRRRCHGLLPGAQRILEALVEQERLPQEVTGCGVSAPQRGVARRGQREQPAQRAAEVAGVRLGDDGRDGGRVARHVTEQADTSPHLGQAR